MRQIQISGAREANLKGITVAIPKDTLVVLTGVSGSGKSSLAVDTLFQECQRQYLEAIGMQGIHKPNVDSVRGASAAVLISQRGYGRNPRSSVGTVTNIYTELRMLYEKLHTRDCPACGAPIKASDCIEETEKRGSDFFVYQICHRCGHRMDKLTRTNFSFNTREGACGACQGLGVTMAIDWANVLDESLSLKGGAVRCWDGAYRDYQTGIFLQALKHYGVPALEDTVVSRLTESQRALLTEGVEGETVKRLFPDVKPPRAVRDGRFEGIGPMLNRKLSEKGGVTKDLERYFRSTPCPDCGGERLNPASRAATVAGVRLPTRAAMSLSALRGWLHDVSAALNPAEHAAVDAYMTDLDTKIRRLADIGLGYLTLDRQTMTLSGGEAQRIKLASVLDADLSGLIYILDEPTVGLHPRDTAGMINVFLKLRDLGNTVIVLEHDPDVMRAADHIIDIGPGSGRHGGQVVGQGPLIELMKQEDSVTGRYLRDWKPSPHTPRAGNGRAITVRGACANNLKSLDADIPCGCLTAITGVSGSGKSTLVFDVIGAAARGGATAHGLDAFGRVIEIEQAQLTRMKRSNIATMTGIMDHLRKLFAALPDARAKGLSARHFSFNAPGGRCEVCEGMGTVTSNLLFFEDVEVPCPVCGGKRFQEMVLSVELNGLTILDALKLSVEEAAVRFADHAAMARALNLLLDVGLGYLELGQTLTTLSGGEAQRLKLATELMGARRETTLYLIDEPTTGLHPLDIKHFLTLLNRLVDAGHTVVAVEHNTQFIEACDYVLDLGPDGGDAGGQVVAIGTPREIAANPASFTGKYLFKNPAET